MNASHKSACGRVIRLNTLFCRLITHRRFPAAQPEQIPLLSCETSGVSHWQRIVAGQKQACSMPAPLSKLSPLVPSTCCHMWYYDQQTLIRAKFSQPQGCQRDQRMVAHWVKTLLMSRRFLKIMPRQTAHCLRRGRHFSSRALPLTCRATSCPADPA